MWGGGAGSKLPTPVLAVSGLSTLVAVIVSSLSIYFHFKNYRKPALQRMVVRIMLMVPIYAISSFISLFSLEAAFFIDAIRDIYEAFVIYCFFVLLLSYLGGERSLLILLHGRPPKAPPFPLNFVKREIDVSDPYTFLFLRRGILQYVQVKPILAVATMILKATGTYNEGNLQARSGYLYVSVIYNVSICLSLYCLALFWICVNDDLKPFRPVPKFLCVKGILFFSFWQSLGISILVAAGAIKRLGPYTDSESISLGLTDTLICLEMPVFAFAHMFAFSHTDFIDKHCMFVARMPIFYAIRDSFGLLDVLEDSRATLRGQGMDYREFEPSEGFMHQGEGRDRRIRAGLRYSKAGRKKYWLPQPTTSMQPPGKFERRVNRVVTRVVDRDQGEEVYAPLLQHQEEDVVHLAPDMQPDDEEGNIWSGPQQSRHAEDTGYELPFGDLDQGDEELFTHSRKYLFGDYNYPCIDASSEQARIMVWDEEERVLRDERGAWFSPIRGARGQVAMGQRQGPAWEGYGAVGTSAPRHNLKTRIEDDFGNALGKTIDYEQDRIPPASPMDVRMQWTKSGQSSSRPQRPHHPAGGTRSRTSSGPSSVESNARRVRSPPQRSRHNSGSNTYPIDSPILPPDAVDLIVEDDEAREEERIRERTKGDPAARSGGVRKVYRRGFVVHTEEGKKAKGEVEAEAPVDRDEEERMHVAEDILEAIGDDGDTLQPPAMEGHNITVARAETPPLHARVRADDIEDDNPWA